MKLLGHRHYQMTLRYAAINVETVTNEYANAARAIEQRYNLPSTNESTSPPTRALTDFARYLLKRVEDDGLNTQLARSLVRRLHRLNTAIQRLLDGSSRPPMR